MLVERPSRRHRPAGVAVVHRQMRRFGKHGPHATSALALIHFVARFRRSRRGGSARNLHRAAAPVPVHRRWKPRSRRRPPSPIRRAAVTGRRPLTMLLQRRRSSISDTPSTTLRVVPVPRFHAEGCKANPFSRRMCAPSPRRPAFARSASYGGFESAEARSAKAEERVGVRGFGGSRKTEASEPPHPPSLRSHSRCFASAFLALRTASAGRLRSPLRGEMKMESRSRDATSHPSFAASHAKKSPSLKRREAERR